MGDVADHLRRVGPSRPGLVATVLAALCSPLWLTPGATAEPSPPYVFIYDFSQSATRWLPGSALPHVARASVPIGTTFSYTQSDPGEATFDFWRIARGRRVGGRCVAPTKANWSRARCERRVGVGRLSHRGRTGRHTLRFEGRINRTTALAPGAYEVELFLYTTDQGDSDSRYLRFTILRPPGGNG